MTYQKLNFRVMLRQRSGLSLIEVLVGLTITLIVLGAMAAAFRFASEEMAKGRASLELTNRLRSVENLFRDDLRRLTVELKPYHRLPASPEGYAEIIDGPATDASNIIAAGSLRDERNLLVGDFDDIFSGTIRSDGTPFRGRRLLQSDTFTTVEESHLAEVFWFTSYTDLDGDGVVEPDDGDRIRLFRRQLIVKPSLGILATIPSGTPQLVNRFIQNNDISCNVRTNTSGEFVIQANSLQDLGRRGNRFAHINGTYPQTSGVNFAWLLSDEQYEDDGTLSTDFNGDGALTAALDLFPHRRASDQSDLLLSDVAAFDIRVFDLNAVSLVTWDESIPDGQRPIIDLALPTDLALSIAANSTNAVRPFDSKFYDASDGSFVNEAAGSVVAERVNRLGAYVDLGKSPVVSSVLSTASIDPRSVGVVGALQLSPAGTETVGTRPALSYVSATNLNAVYDTGTSDYDTTEILGALPFGANGIDDDADGIVDSDEKLVPPYNVNIRGLEVVIRMYEPNAGQATQISLKQSMVPE